MQTTVERSTNPSNQGVSSRRAIIVEFVGLPGAGKTTLQEKLAAALSSRGYSAWTPRAIFAAEQRAASQRSPFRPRLLAGFWRKTSARLGHLSLWAATLAASSKLLWVTAPRILTSQRPLGDKYYSLRLLLGSLVSLRYVTTRAGAGQIVLLGEGPAQRADAIFVDRHSSVNIKQLTRFARLLPRPDLLVYLRVSAAVSAERASSRERGLPRRLQGLDEAQLGDWLAKDQQVFDVLAAEMASVGGEAVRVVTLDTDDLEQVNRQFEERLVPVISRLMGLE